MNSCVDDLVLALIFWAEMVHADDDVEDVMKDDDDAGATKADTDEIVARAASNIAERCMLGGIASKENGGESFVSFVVSAVCLVFPFRRTYDQFVPCFVYESILGDSKMDKMELSAILPSPNFPKQPNNRQPSGKAKPHTMQP
eukprot:scaffold2027_cov315-Alexandrium_tamarense.AAC.2